jgi:hypothetical protein
VGRFTPATVNPFMKQYTPEGVKNANPKPFSPEKFIKYFAVPIINSLSSLGDDSVSRRLKTFLTAANGREVSLGEILIIFLNSKTIMLNKLY